MTSLDTQEKYDDYMWQRYSRQLKRDFKQFMVRGLILSAIVVLPILLTYAILGE